MLKVLGLTIPRRSCSGRIRIDAGEITGSQWNIILKHKGATDEEIRGAQMRMGRPSLNFSSPGAAGKVTRRPDPQGLAAHPRKPA
jgi:hypothetical protein